MNRFMRWMNRHFIATFWFRYRKYCFRRREHINYFERLCVHYRKIKWAEPTNSCVIGGFFYCFCRSCFRLFSAVKQWGESTEKVELRNSTENTIEKKTRMYRRVTTWQRYVQWWADPNENNFYYTYTTNSISYFILTLVAFIIAATHRWSCSMSMFKW